MNTTPNSDIIDVKDLIESFDFDEHVRRSDAYFATLQPDDWRFYKPFYGPSAISGVLVKIGQMFDLAALYHGATVMDFGCGTAWLSRIVARLGCNAIAVDVAQTPLRMADDFTRRTQPDLADKITYSVYDSQHIDLPDESVDCILCHDAFHHVADQKITLTELYRVLRPEGRAVFVEPGPNHSRSPMSQFEMRNYGVIENDIRIEQIDEIAREVGFYRLDVSLFAVRGHAIPVAHYMQIYKREVESAQQFAPDAPAIYRSLAMGSILNERIFVIYKSKDSLQSDSRRHDGTLGSIKVLNATKSEGSLILDVEITNTGRTIWRPSGSGHGAVNLGLQLYSEKKLAVENFMRHNFLTERLRPEETVVTRVVCKKPIPAEHQLRLNLVAENVLWFNTPGGGVLVEMPI